MKFGQLRKENSPACEITKLLERRKENGFRHRGLSPSTAQRGVQSAVDVESSNGRNVVVLMMGKGVWIQIPEGVIPDIWTILWGRCREEVLGTSKGQQNRKVQESENTVGVHKGLDSAILGSMEIDGGLVGDKIVGSKGEWGQIEDTECRGTRRQVHGELQSAEISSNPRLPKLMEKFLDFIDAHGLMDLPLIGAQGFFGPYPLLLDSGGIGHGKSPFCSENMRMHKEELKELVSDWWQNYRVVGSPGHSVIK
ncbi:hypothetical protein F0562_012133 [Nyssa sinensis]|uniref:Uncharacterized protein n=1 Tax=Nyssa sinensis TaxID=561372 RepID=A0A5J4ZWJ4_9ASTE|nr:hypothetical protein F0562_012133 [Nyssa sinensis]